MVDYIKYLFLPRLGLYPLMLELYNALNEGEVPERAAFRTVWG